MTNFYFKDDSNFGYKVGDSSDGLTSLPIYNSLKVYELDIMNGSSTSVPSHSTADISSNIGVKEIESYCSVYPIAIVGIDASIAYYINISKLYLTYNSNGTADVHVRLANTSNSAYTVSRIHVFVLCALRTARYLPSAFGDIYGGDVSD